MGEEYKLLSELFSLLAATVSSFKLNFVLHGQNLGMLNTVYRGLDCLEDKCPFRQYNGLFVRMLGAVLR